MGDDAIYMLASDGKPYYVAQLVAHNATFDGPFLQSWYERLHTFLPARYTVLCTLQRALWYFREYPEEPHPVDFKLATLCRHFSVTFDAASAHEALGDVSATVGLYRALVHNGTNALVYQPMREVMDHLTEDELLVCHLRRRTTRARKSQGNAAA